MEEKSTLTDVDGHEFRWLIAKSGLTLSAFSRYLGKHRTTVFARLNVGGNVPALYVVALMKLTGKPVFEELRAEYTREHS